MRAIGPPVTRVVNGAEHVMSLRQWTDAYVQYLSAKYPDARRAECRATATMNAHSWRDQVVQAYNTGAYMPTRLLRSLDGGLLWRLARSTRALASDEETQDLLERSRRAS